jgi:alpha-amylase
MYAIGEWVDGNPNAGAPTDTWIQTVQGRSGTLDFALRYGIKDMVDQPGGSYSLKAIKGKQQYNRTKIATFVNSHDTFRPKLGSTGNYTGWYTANELSGHIEAKDARSGVAYAIAMTVDGSPLIWIEDLFNIGYTGKRWSHVPTNETDLPVFDDMANLIRCHNKLSF